MYVCVYYVYVVKVISLSEEAYKILKKMKRNSMSFSDVIIKNLVHTSKDKTENLKDLIEWTKKLSFPGKKKRISTKIDEIVYDVSKSF